MLRNRLNETLELLRNYARNVKKRGGRKISRVLSTRSNDCKIESEDTHLRKGNADLDKHKLNGACKYEDDIDPLECSTSTTYTSAL